ncbi:hypothetical protein RN81_00155 [Streptococcus anginosus]|nr:hypothetical protein RN81_00155 [Streptococcus anginosus]OFL58812.1 hypothetical protein HMPREF2761_02290 [Streptococcus sp. HMSC057E02]OFP46535.1 hypothetical protein HMPREF2984_08595 [Streptococcus sp. HMSC066E07]OHS91133.1 hypothetical protein HMPREF3249_08905 [Streptococcus sp. HMSC36C04]PRT67839.1 hypothetical protein C6A29_01395 [Streptococcus anginosus]
MEKYLFLLKKTISHRKFCFLLLKSPEYMKKFAAYQKKQILYVKIRILLQMGTSSMRNLSPFIWEKSESMVILASCHRRLGKNLVCVGFFLSEL